MVKILNHIHAFDIFRIHNRHSYSDLENDFENYLSSVVFTSGIATSNHNWLNIYEDLRVIFTKYFTVSDEMKCEKLEIEDFFIAAFNNINKKYIKKPLTNVTQLSIIKAYPQRINNLITDDLKSTDGYFPFIFRIVYNINKVSLARNFFLNYTYGYFIENKWNININKSFNETVVNFYTDIFRTIPEELYYYADTDMLFLPKKNVNIIKAYFDYNDIKYEIENNIKLRFFGKKIYFSIDKSDKVKHGPIPNNLINSTATLFNRIILNTKLKKVKHYIL